MSEEFEKIIDAALDNMNESEKASLFKLCEGIVNDLQISKLTKRNIGISEATILQALTIYGYTRKELKDLTIKFGDVGSVGEYVQQHPKQRGMGDYF